MPRKRMFLSPSFLPKDEVPEFILADLAEQQEAQERRFRRGHIPLFWASDLDLLAEEGISAGSVSVLPPIGKSRAERRPEIKERKEEVRLPPLRGQLGTSLARQPFRAPQVQQRFPPQKSTTQEREKPRTVKISSKKSNEEIACHLPRVEKGRTAAPPVEMEGPNVQSLRARQVLSTLETYRVSREGWRKKVEQNRLLPARPKEYLSFVKKMELEKRKGL